jgi:protein CpxP
MSSITFARGVRALRSHHLVLVGLLGASIVAAPMASIAQPAPAPAATTPSAPMHAHARSRMMKGETVEQRVAMLHSSLMITRAEEPQWIPVAQAMRENEASMQKLIAETTAKPHPMNAVEDLRTYERFTQAHVNGLKNLISSFETLYQSMPDSQKATADQVFRKFGARGPAHAS